MKYLYTALLVMFNTIGAQAQSSNLFVDAGISFARLYPGATVAYNYNIVRFVGLGVGVQAYDFHVTIPNFQFVPAAFGELRVNLWPREKHQFFSFLDIGMDYYRHNGNAWSENNEVYNVQKDNGIYTGIGMGYLWRWHYYKSLRWGYYVSVKMISNSYQVNDYDLATGKQSVVGWGDATLVASFGCKF